MKIDVKKFGEMLVSRPAGREAYLALQAYQLRDVSKEETIELDFDGVKVLTPSWADEVITPVTQNFSQVTFSNTENPTVKATLETLEKYSGVKV